VLRRWAASFPRAVHAVSVVRAGHGAAEDWNSVRRE
jgi:hypothetical protein